jgi:gentisate 1,2-dioxygenase
MEQGDFLTTPKGLWHGHGHDGGGPVMWMDTLDIPLIYFLNGPDEFDGYAVEYINPSTGKTANPNIASWMQKLPSGYHSKAHRHTSSSVFQVYKGSGYSVINGVKFEWSQGDYFVIPNWAWHEHVVTSNEDAYLFLFTTFQ